MKRRRLGGSKTSKSTKKQSLSFASIAKAVLKFKTGRFRPTSKATELCSHVQRSERLGYISKKQADALYTIVGAPKGYTRGYEG